MPLPPAPREPSTALAPAVETVPARSADAHALELRAALGDGLAEVTIADAAARSGLSLADAERGLHRLSLRHRGHLAVTERGELLFRFPQGFAIDHQKRDARREALARVGRAATTVASWVARLGLTIFLVGYAGVFAIGLLIAAIALAFASESDGPLEGAGLIVWGVLELVSEGLYWSMHPALANDGQARALRDQGRKAHFYEQVNRLFLGPPVARDDPQRLRRAVTQEIRARAGRIGRSDVERVTGLPPAQAEALLTTLVVDYDGHVEVDDDGAILHAFPALRPPTAALPAEQAATPAWLQPVPRPQFAGNPSGRNAVIIGTWAFVVALAGVGVAMGLPWYLAELPCFGGLALGAVPLLRYPSFLRRRAAALEAAGSRAMLQTIHAAASERRGVTIEELTQTWRESTGVAPDPDQLQRRLLEHGGELVIDDDGGTQWRFRELEQEFISLASARDHSSNDEQATGAVVFRSDA
ncbi:MAG: hypothetical protein IPK74_24560 [Deltaproteobacteria bacterium]|nr:hypothetical protein [Deltaproteobacteria bacterium]